MVEQAAQRLLRQHIPGCIWTGNLVEPYVRLSDVSDGGGWEVYQNDNNVHFLIYRTYFDISGWSKDQFSAFIGGVGWQESDRWTVNDASPPPAAGEYGIEFQSWDLVTKSKISNSALDGDTWLDGFGIYGWNAPGMPKSNYNLEEVFAGRMRQWVPDSTIQNIVHQNSEALFGAGDVTAGSRIYVTRIVAVNIITVGGEDATVGVVPPQAVIVPATLALEKDLQYIERLRRSYVDAQSRT